MHRLHIPPLCMVQRINCAISGTASIQSSTQSNVCSHLIRLIIIRIQSRHAIRLLNDEMPRKSLKKEKITGKILTKSQNAKNFLNLKGCQMVMHPMLWNPGIRRRYSNQGTFDISFSIQTSFEIKFIRHCIHEVFVSFQMQQT